MLYQGLKLNIWLTLEPHFLETSETRLQKELFLQTEQNGSALNDRLMFDCTGRMCWVSLSANKPFGHSSQLWVLVRSTPSGYKMQEHHISKAA